MTMVIKNWKMYLGFRSNLMGNLNIQMSHHCNIKYQEFIFKKKLKEHLVGDK